MASSFSMPQIAQFGLNFKLSLRTKCKLNYHTSLTFFPLCGLVSAKKGESTISYCFRHTCSQTDPQVLYSAYMFTKYHNKVTKSQITIQILYLHSTYQSLTVSFFCFPSTLFYCNIWARPHTQPEEKPFRRS